MGANLAHQLHCGRRISPRTTPCPIDGGMWYRRVSPLGNPRWTNRNAPSCPMRTSIRYFLLSNPFFMRLAKKIEKKNEKKEKGEKENEKKFDRVKRNGVNFVSH